MPFNGSGAFSPPGANYPAVAATLIESADRNAIDSDFATGLSTAICKDGQTTVTANIPLAGFKLTGVGAGTARTDAATLATVQDGTGIYMGTVGGTADVITLATTPAIAAYVAGQTFCFVASGANTGAVTVAVSGLAAKAITKNGTTALAAGDIPSGALITITYDGTRFQLTGYMPTGVFLPLAGGTVTGATVFSNTLTAIDGNFSINGSGDATKQAGVEVDGNTTAQRRVGTWPDYNFRFMSQTHGADIASAGTTVFDAASGDLVDVTGTTSITAITLAEGRWITARFTGALTLTHGASLVLPGAANITTEAGDIAEFRGYAAGVVRLTKYLRLNARMMVDAITSTSAVATTSGTTVALTTTVPTWAKRVTLLFDSVSSNGTADYLVQLGDSGGLETSGYVAESAVTTAAATGVSTSTAGFIVRSASAGNVHNGKMELMLSGTANTWIATHVMRQATNSLVYGGGIKATSATMDRISITTVGGADTFDTGSITVLYE